LIIEPKKLWKKAVEMANEIRHGENFDDILETLPHLQLFMRRDEEAPLTRMKLADIVVKAT
jgi:hypothetical protein